MKIGENEEGNRSNPQSAFHHCVIQHSASLPCGEIDVRDYVWDHHTADAWTSCAYFIDMALTPRPDPNWAVHVSGSRRRRTELGNLWFVPPGCAIESGAAPGRLKTMQLMLADTLFDELFDRPPAWADLVVRDGFAIDGGLVRSLLTHIHRELAQPGFASGLMIETLARAVALSIARSVDDHSAAMPAILSGGLGPWRMRLVRERVYADLPAPRLNELAALCGVSVRHLGRAFKAETGETIAGFVQRATIERARAKLEDPSLSIAEIAAMLGFAKPSGFTYAFARATGMPPSAVRGSRRTH